VVQAAENERYGADMSAHQMKDADIMAANQMAASLQDQITALKQHEALMQVRSKQPNSDHFIALITHCMDTHHLIDR
jgi:hypothetical protein